MQFSDVDYRDIQGLVRFGHGHLHEASYHLLTIRDAAAAGAWLRAAKVTTCVTEHRLPDTALQVAFTYDGLVKLFGDAKIPGQLSHEFRAGMAEPNRARRLGDIGTNAPADWYWGGPGKQPHVLVMLYARTGELAKLETDTKDKTWEAAFSALECLPTHDIGDIEPFGFRDGISQPMLDWERQKPTRLRETAAYTNIAALGEFLLGYANEYGRYTDRPLIEPSEDPDDVLHFAEDIPGKKDFGRNGTYLVLRDLEQDVPRFWQFVDEQAGHDPDKRRRLAAAMIGRLPNGLPDVPSDFSILPADDPRRIMPFGAPLAPLGEVAVAGVGPDLEDIWLNQFTYAGDPDGTACPLGAHIRRANPRNADLPHGTRGPLSRLIRRLGFGSTNPHGDVIASTRFHRILRRGREYGSELKPDDAVKKDAPADERGLRFICLNANIARQFEFIQTSWLANAKFDGLDEEDPLLGNRAKLWAGGTTDTFTRPLDSGLSARVPGLEQFVKVRGGAYFFMPGLRALHYMARRNP